MDLVNRLQDLRGQQPCVLPKRREVLLELLDARRPHDRARAVPSPVTRIFAKCLPSWPPSTEIRNPDALKAGEEASQTVF